MITDKETNFAYISSLLETTCPTVFRQLNYWFKELEIDYAILLNTKDIWVVDFMPLQIDQHSFLQFKYDPDYLKPINVDIQELNRLTFLAIPDFLLNNVI